MNMPKSDFIYFLADCTRNLNCNSHIYQLFPFTIAGDILSGHEPEFCSLASVSLLSNMFHRSQLAPRCLPVEPG